MRSLLIQSLFFFILLFRLNVFADTTHVLLESSSQSSDNYNGHMFDGEISHDFDTSFNLGVGAENLSRTYSDGTQLTDTLIGVSSVEKINPSFYLEDRATAATSASVYSKWSAMVTPHWVKGTGDAGLGFKYDEYKTTEAYTLTPSYFYSFTDDFGLGAGTFLVESGDFLAAYQAQMVWKFLHRNSLRLVGAGGRTIEDAGLEADFTSGTIKYTYDLTSRLQVCATFINYRSQIRNEQSLGLGFGYR